jgi:Ca2+-binding RTX toxin-like protein
MVNRATDSYTLWQNNTNMALNAQIHDADGGSYTLRSLAMAEAHLGGSKNSSVVIFNSQYGWVETGAGNDRITIDQPLVWRAGSSTTFRAEGGAGNDTIVGWTSSYGRLEADGGLGNDIIRGTAAADRIEGGAGNDLMTGAAGADAFVFVRGEGGADTITDFAPGSDLLVFEGFTRGDIVVTATRVHTLIRAGADQTVLLQGITPAQLGDWAFSFA